MLLVYCINLKALHVHIFSIEPRVAPLWPLLLSLGTENDKEPLLHLVKVFGKENNICLCAVTVFKV